MTTRNQMRREIGPANRELAADAGNRSVQILLLMVVFLLGAAIRIENLAVAQRSPDERIYSQQARDGPRNAIHRYIFDRLWFYPPPTRIGYTSLLAATMTVTGSADETAGSYVSTVASLLTLLVAMRLGLRFLGGWITVLGLLFLAVFPPELVIARRCWSDAPVGLASLVMIYFALEIWSGGGNLLAYVGLPLAGAGAFLIKETSAILYAVCFLISLWAVLRRSSNLHAAGVLVGAAVFSGAGVLLLLDVAIGSLGLSLQTVTTAAGMVGENTYAIEYQSGAAYLLLLTLAKLSPVTMSLAALGIVLILCALMRDSLRDPQPAALLAWLTLGNLALYSVVPHWLNVRFVSASFAPLCLFAGGGIHYSFLLVRRKLQGEALTAAVVSGVAFLLFSVVADYERFQQSFVWPETQDLSVKMVSQALDHPMRSQVR